MNPEYSSRNYNRENFERYKKNKQTLYTTHVDIATLSTIDEELIKFLVLFKLKSTSFKFMGNWQTVNSLFSLVAVCMKYVRFTAIRFDELITKFLLAINSVRSNASSIYTNRYVHEANPLNQVLSSDFVWFFSSATHTKSSGYTRDTRTYCWTLFSYLR